VRLSALRPDLPAWVEATLGRAIAADPAQRFRDMAEFGRAPRRSPAPVAAQTIASPPPSLDSAHCTCDCGRLGDDACQKNTNFFQISRSPKKSASALYFGFTAEVAQFTLQNHNKDIFLDISACRGSS
jgi:hypothetical protein